MADAGTDTFVGVVAALVAAVFVVAAATGDPLTGPPSTGSTSTRPSTTRAAAGRSAPSFTNIPGGPLVGCRGDIIADRTAGTGAKTLNIKVYYTSAAGGRNCAVATKAGSVGTSHKGSVEVTLKFATYTGNRWPKAAQHRSNAGAARSGAVYLNDADARCVTARAVFTPADGGRSTIVDTGRVGCD